MKNLSSPLLEMQEFNHLLKVLGKEQAPITITGPSDSQKAHLCYSICDQLDCRAIYITNNELQARKMHEDFSFFYGEDAILLTPKEIMLYDIEAKSYEDTYRRINALDRMINLEYRIVVTSIEAVMQKLAQKELFQSSSIYFHVGGKMDIQNVSLKLIAIGYERVQSVDGTGQFAVRGGIVDIFPINTDFAIRIELFDDEIDSIRRFDIHTQRSIDTLATVKVLSARELLYPIEKKDEIIGRVEKDLALHIQKFKRDNSTDFLQQKVEKDLERMKSEYYFPGIDRYTPYILESFSDIFDYCEQSLVFMDEPENQRLTAETVISAHTILCESLLEKGQILPQIFNIFSDFDDITKEIEKRKTIHLTTMSIEGGRFKTAEKISFASKQISTSRGHIEIMAEEIKAWKIKKCRVIILSGSHGKGERLKESLLSFGLEVTYTEDMEKTLLPGQVIITKGSLNKGFEYPTIGLVVVSDKEFFGQGKRARRTQATKGLGKISVFTDLSQGDYVVHQSHGIGQYIGLQQLQIDSIKKDYLKILYQDGAFLYIPTNQLDLIQKYIGSEGKAPRLNKLGGAEWVKTKNRVKESLQELATELIVLYAKREASQGHVFSKDTIWQKQLEEQFIYEETPDQLKCIDEIKKDMELQRPMDRLLCGDVGYGKTEVAIRAVFKACMDGKQTAYLVPTTILAQQHYNNFKERMKDFPITIDVISRFRSKAEQKKVLKDVKAGVIDVLIGTHRLLQNDIEFKDLGLLIVDEEQRFGVTHKEKLKGLKSNIDVLTLSATPIPRTLHMSLVGIRDISIIEDPPMERYPVQTYVMEHNDDVIREAILRELGRKGQLFYLYNRVRTIQKKAFELQELVPEARVAYAHGQMNEKELEDIMFNFINGEYDILVCTTIIESGLDMPNVNTIVVEDADKMGLSQLHQLRGRVGRSNRHAYAYITYKRDKALSEVASKRLQAIREFTELGSGFKIAMRDLEIRGAGNLLGPEQHGQMESVGYEMYCRLLDEAVRELKGDSQAGQNIEVSIDINVNAYIDQTYISHEYQKIEMYKRIASIQNDQDVLDIQDEFIDRYGEMPNPVKNLIDVAWIKAMAGSLGFSSVAEKNGSLVLQLHPAYTIGIETISKLSAKYKRQLLFNAGSTPYLSYRISPEVKSDVLFYIKILLQDIKSFTP